MTKRYGDPILVAEHIDKEPRCFIWRGTSFRVKEVLGRFSRVGALIFAMYAILSQFSCV